MKNFGILIFVVSLISSLVTTILHFIFRKKRFVKYIPSILYLLAVAYNFYQSRQPNQGMESLANVIYIMIFIIAIIGNLLTGIALDLKTRKHM